MYLLLCVLPLEEAQNIGFVPWLDILGTSVKNILSALRQACKFSFYHLLFKTMPQSYNYRIFTDLQVISDCINIALYFQRQYIRTVFSHSFNFPHEVFCWTKELSKKKSCQVFVCCGGQIYQ